MLCDRLYHDYHRTKNPPKLSKEEIEQMKKDYEIFKAAIERGKDMEHEWD